MTSESNRYLDEAMRAFQAGPNIRSSVGMVNEIRNLYGVYQVNVALLDDEIQLSVVGGNANEISAILARYADENPEIKFKGDFVVNRTEGRTVQFNHRQPSAWESVQFFFAMIGMAFEIPMVRRAALVALAVVVAVALAIFVLL